MSDIKYVTDLLGVIIGGSGDIGYWHAMASPEFPCRAQACNRRTEVGYQGMRINKLNNLLCRREAIPHLV
jgi:hypothetical protein